MLDACADLLGSATESGEARGDIASALKGVAWTPRQEAALQRATKRLVKERDAFITVARQELGAVAVVLPLESASRQHTGDADVIRG